MPNLSQAAITLSSRILPPGWAMTVTPDLCARSMLSPKGKKASEPSATSVFFYSQTFCSSFENTGGFTLKLFSQTPSARTSIYSSEI